MTQSTGALSDVVARIVAPAPSDTTVAAASALTGELARLADWWSAVAAGQAVVAVEVRCTSGTIADGLAAADRAIDAGATLILPRVVARDARAAHTVFALLTRREASSVVHQPVGMPDRDWMVQVGEVRDAVRAATLLRGEPEKLADELCTDGIATAVGVLLGAAARRTPSVLDGTDELAAALIADRICYRAKGWWRPGSTSPDPGRAAAIDRLDIEPGLPLGLSDESGLGARATLALLDITLNDGVDA